MIIGMAWGITLVVLGGVALLSGLRVIKEYERSVLFTFGKFSKILEPGLRVIIPIVQTHQKVDMRVRVADVPDQEAMTKDNISVKINAVIYYKVTESKKAILEVEHYRYAVSQLAQTTMRNIVGEFELDDVLSNRDKVAKKIKDIVDAETDPWGIKVNSVELKDVILPDNMKRVIGKQAEAERERRAVVTKAIGEVESAENMAKAAHMLSSSPGALHLRTLQSINDIASDQSNTIVFAVPLQILEAFEGFSKKTKKK
jgi:regulator of protease activity HflC (stomatin/prohibitin superfamily)